MKTGEIKHPEPIVPNNVNGHWFGDMDMYYNGERALGSEIEFYTNGGWGYDRYWDTYGYGAYIQNY